MDSTQRNYVVTNLPCTLGLDVQFKIEVTNLGGYKTMSVDYLQVTLADVPSQPSMPACDFAFTNDSRIRIEFTEPYLGGSQIISNEV